MMVNADDVIKFHGLKPQSLGFEKNEKEKLEYLIDEWISESESIIKSYTNNQFKNEVPAAVKNVCKRLTSNMINLAIQNRDSPLIKHNDWNTSIVKNEIFTDGLKADLEPFVIEHSSRSDKVSFYAITGDD